MRMRKKPNLVPRMEACQSVLIDNPADYRGNWMQWMPHAKELRLEIGCGKGKFTVETAIAEPDVLIIAVEKVPAAMVNAMELALKHQLTNVFFIDADAEILPTIFQDGEIDRIYLNFCDPWPRSKSAKLRLTYRSFLEKYQQVLKENGEIHFKTDNRPLFDFSVEEFSNCGLELKNLSYDLHKDGIVGVMTGYEEKFHGLGTPINQCHCVIHKDAFHWPETGKQRRIKMERIQMTTPLVEMDGDEMTRIIWQSIKKRLLLPFVELKTEYYDLGLPYRDKTLDKVTFHSAEAIKKYGVGVKCATITPNGQRMTEYNLTEMWKSPNGTIRAELDGTVFRAPILVDGICPSVRTWTAPITIARHAYGDVYRGTEYRATNGGKAELVFTDAQGNETRQTIYDFECDGIVTGQYNKDSSIESFARACFQFALDSKQDLWFSTKDTIAKIYDGNFKEIFQRIFDEEYESQFKAIGITYFYTLIDDAIARVIRSSGGFIWACKNYDGDVMSDMVSTAFGSLAMMTSVLVSPDGKYEYEAAHGTVTRHYYKHLEGEKTSTNPMATIFAWTGALRKRGELDGNTALMNFADKLDEACIAVIQSGTMTKDLAALWENGEPNVLTTDEFIEAIREKLIALIEA